LSGILDRQKLLQKEADEVVELLGLGPMLASIGRPVRVGSSAMGLMVKRDIDLTVVCERLGAATLKTFSEIGARLMLLDKHVVCVRFRNDMGVWNADPAAYPDGLYLWLSVRTPDGNEWTVDIWAVDQPERQPDLRHLRILMPRITDEYREVILRIKQVLMDRQRSSETRVASALVCQAVMDDGIREITDFDEWLNNRQGP
jgi:hypothetical protein